MLVGSEQGGGRGGLRTLAAVRLAIIGPAHPYKGGIVHHTTELAHRLTAAGHEVCIESWSQQYPERLYPGEQRVSEPDVAPHPCTRYPLSWRRPDSWWRLGRRLRHEVEAVVLVVVTPVQVPAYLVVLAALGRGSRGRPVRTLALCHNVLPHEPSRVDRPLVTALLRQVDAVLVHGERERALAAGMTRSLVRVVPMAPHSPTDRPAQLPPADRPACRRLLFFGLVRPYKGLDVLLRAVAAGPPGVALTVAGEFWGGVEPYKQLAEALGVGDRVEWRPGYLPAAELPGLLAGSDAMVLPYRSATASQNVDLAFSHGLPVVVSRTGALADGVRDGVDGLVVEPEDEAGLAAALTELYAPGRLTALRQGVLAADTAAATATAWEQYLSAVETCLAPTGDGS